MVTTEQRTIHIKSGDNGIGSGLLNIINYEKNDRLKRALKMLGLFWLFSLLSIPIVIAHWVLVPGFFIAGPIVAYRRYQMGSEIKNAIGQCPACQNEITVEMEPADNLPKWTYCPNCSASIQLVE